MNDIFTIGDFCFRLSCPGGIAIPSNFLKFRGGDQPAYTYTIDLADELPRVTGEVLAQREDLLALQTEFGECRYIGVRGWPEPYACYVETAPDAACVTLAAHRTSGLNIDPVFVSLLALERRLLERDGLILHCAYTQYKGHGILFSAPSETGKTTQANLWKRYRGAEIINGDRALLQKIGGVWHARGWPVCGSSKTCFVRDVPIQAVVMLSQAAEDRAWRLSPGQAFAQVYRQITVNRWNRAANLKAMELAEDLITRLRVYHLACTMEETAVTALERAMWEI